MDNLDDHLITGVAELAFQGAQIISRRVRINLMKNTLMNHRRPSTKAKEQAGQLDPEKLKIFIENISYGDWFVLYQMSKNLDHKFFVDFVVRLSTKVNAIKPEGK